MNLRNVLTSASARILLRDAELLASEILGRERVWLIAHPETELAPAQREVFLALVNRRAAHEPLQYLLGHAEFYGLPLHVTPAVLIPRPETELLVEQALLWAAAQPLDPAADSPATLRFADVGTGSGAVAIAVATHLAAARITALDLSAAALTVAEDNARNLGCSDRIRFLRSNVLEGLQPEFAADRGGPRFDAVLSNPPYVSSGDAAGMQMEVVGHEPHLALFGGVDGLDIIRRLIPQSEAALRPGGLLAFEFGFGQRDSIALLLARWKDVRFVDDYAGIPRIALATRS